MTPRSASPVKKKGVLAKNTVINIMGRGIPLLFAVAAIPFVIDGLGTERFGVLTIVWIIIGYFGLFDMGLGRATTKFVADQEARGVKDLAPIILTSLLLLIGLGVVGGMLIVALTPYLVNVVLNIPDDLITETTRAFYVLSFSIPLVLGSVGAQGVLEAQQRFGVVNAIKIPASIINYAGPLLVLPFSNQLHHVVIVLVLARAITFVMYCYYCLDEIATFDITLSAIIKWGREMLGFGAWITVSNIISPIMVYVDRFILGALLTMSAVAYYTTPYEMVTRLLIISGSFMGVMFPAFSVYSIEDRQKVAELHQKSIRYLLLALLPMVLFLVVTAEPLLFYWLGSEFAIHSTPVLQLLAVGVLANSIAGVPYTALQAVGRPDITAKLHMVELPIYLAMIWFFTQAMGIVGVALAWLLRVAIDAGLLLFFCHRLVGLSAREETTPSFFTIAAVYTGGLLLFWGGSYLLTNRLLLIGLGLGGGALAFYIIWSKILQYHEKNRILALYGQAKQIVFTNSDG